MKKLKLFLLIPLISLSCFAFVVQSKMTACCVPTVKASLPENIEPFNPLFIINN